MSSPPHLVYLTRLSTPHRRPKLDGRKLEVTRGVWLWLCVCVCVCVTASRSRRPMQIVVLSSQHHKSIFSALLSQQPLCKGHWTHKWHLIMTKWIYGLFRTAVFKPLLRWHSREQVWKNRLYVVLKRKLNSAGAGPHSKQPEVLSLSRLLWNVTSVFLQYYRCRYCCCDNLNKRVVKYESFPVFWHLRSL